jgi:hypothetical protein
MNKWIGLLVLVILQTTLAACVELKDPDKGDDAPTVAPVQELAEKAPELLVKERMYIYQGQILTADEIQRLYNKKTADTAARYYSFHYGKIIFTAAGELFTMGNSVDITADEVESNGGNITTFPPENMKAALNTKGQGGGFVNLQFRQIEGQVAVNLRGQDGGDGMTNPGGSCHQMQVCPREGVGPLPEVDGIAGSVGQKGGDSGSLRLSGETQSFKIFSTYTAGHGGRGGAASAPCRCVYPGTGFFDFKDGNPGPNGPTGPDGAILK